MIIDSVTICDFRSFSGVHEISLKPRVKYGATRPIVLFGGLNGSGKTTLLLAIKFALYGRHALGLGTSKSDYERFIKGCIHAPPAALIKPNSAYVVLKFTYGKLGKKSIYQVRRDWHVDGKTFRESLRLFEDGVELNSLTQDECQGFLNELVPVGVSELFFFDGEKIAELAEDDTGGALGDAIRRLLGLDLVERLRNDLRVYALKYENRRGKNNQREDFEKLEQSFTALKMDIAAEEKALEVDQAKLERLEIERDRRETQLTDRGGDWGKSREDQKGRAADLTATLHKREGELRHELNGSYPLSLALDTLKECVRETSLAVAASLDRRALDTVSTFVCTFKERVGAQLKGKAKEVLETTFAEFSSSFGINSQGLPDVSARELGSLEQIIDQTIPGAAVRVRGIANEIAEASDSLDQITVQIDRAPEAETLRAELESVAEINRQVGELRAEISVRSRDLRSLYLAAIERAKLLRGAHEAASENQQLEQPLEYATKARLLLKEFGHINAERKVARLEVEFAEAFRRLSRKDDIVVQAKIDPEKFTVVLIDREATVVNKSQLSAGEKQIYAIAMLEALARTSGRRLPVIIDTPLGRLDSKHRTNLVEHYFPGASHQVVLLSTDTEVDEQFYQSLSPHVSHAFEIVFDETEKASSLREGYFWRQALKEAV